MELYPDQHKSFEELKTAFKKHRSVLFQAPTGWGKTALGCKIATGVISKGTRAAFVVHREELVEQTCRAFDADGIEYAVIAPGYPKLDRQIQVCSVYTLQNRLDHLFDLMIIDECHHMAAKTWRDIAERNARAYKLGLTATPVRLDGSGLRPYFETMVCGLPPKDLIAMGRLCPYEYWAPATVDLSGLKRSGHDYSIKSIEKAMLNKAITGNAIEHYKRLGNNQPFIAFCASVAHAKAVAEEFRAAGYPVESVDAKMDKTSRRETIRALGKTLIGITACDLISEGLDVPGATVAIMLRPTESLVICMQQWGRVLRTAPGKAKAIIIDCVSNFLRHQLPDSPRTWSLDGIKKRSKKKHESDYETRFCPECFGVHEWAPECPYCGYVYQEKPKELPKVVKGELQKVTPEDIAALEQAVREKGGLRDWHKLGQARAQLDGKPYKPGWGWTRWKNSKRARAAC